MAETTKKTTTTATKKTTTTKAEKTFTEAEVKKLIKEAVASAVSENENKVVKVTTETPMVKLLWQSDCSVDNLVMFGMNGKYGSLTGATGRLNVTKEAFLGEFRDSFVQLVLSTRELIVLDGLTDEERMIYGVDYRENEFLQPKVIADVMGNIDFIYDIFADLCPKYKEIVATKILEAYEKGDTRVAANRKQIVAMNKISQKDYAEYPADHPMRKGILHTIVEAMNAKEIEG